MILILSISNMCQCQSSVTENVQNWNDSNPESFWLIPIIWTHARWQSSQNSQVSIILLYSKLIWYPKSVSINRDCHHHNSIWNVQLVMLGGSVFLQPRPWHTPHISVHGRLCFRQVHLPVLQAVITKNGFRRASGAAGSSVKMARYFPSSMWKPYLSGGRSSPSQAITWW